MTTQQTERVLSEQIEVGKRIHMLMWERRLTLAQVAPVVGVSDTNLGRKLRGQVPITVDELMRIARLLNVEPGDLLPRLDSNQQPCD